MSLTITSFQASNFKKLTAVSITPEGHVVVLAGENGAGKSSILDGIETTLAGRDSLPEKPIRDGATKGFTETTLSNGLVMRRAFSASGATLTIKNGEGEPQRSPQALLDKLIGNLAFDPLAFSRLKPAEQRDTLQKLVGLDFSAREADKKKYYDERTAVNREVDRLTAVLNGLSLAHKDAPSEEISAAQILKEIEEAEAHNCKVTKAGDHALYCQNNVRVVATEIAEAKKQIEAWQKILADRELKLDAAKHDLEAASAQAAFLTPIPVPKDKLISLESENLKVRQNKQRAETRAALDAATEKSAGMTKFIEAVDAEKTELLRKTKFPLPGLSFTEEGVFYNNIPFSQISDGEKLRVSVAMGMAMNPELRVIFIRDGSLLDQKGLALVAEMAAANKYQVWMEDARSTDPAAIVIEDGHVKKYPACKGTNCGCTDGLSHSPECRAELDACCQEQKFVSPTC